jgi:hypothetical protein
MWLKAGRADAAGQLLPVPVEDDLMSTLAKRMLLVAGLVMAVVAIIWLVRMSYVLTD